MTSDDKMAHICDNVAFSPVGTLVVYIWVKPFKRGLGKKNINNIK